jgi:MFS-type transporter involved in bile tolerance (Atg22 family)
VALISTIAGILSAAFMPYAGAVIDFTSKRRTFGSGMAALVAVASIGLLLLLPSTWLPISVVCISAGALAYHGHSLARWAYVREIVDSDGSLAGIVASMRFWQLLSQLLYLALIVAVTAPFGLSDIVTARIAQGVSAIVCTPMLIHAWRTFGTRAAKHTLEPGQSLWTAGVRELWRTLNKLGEESPGLRKLLLVTAMLTAPTVAFTSLAVTFLTQQLAVPNSQVALFAGLTLVSGLPGALLFRWLSRRLGHRDCLIGAIAWWIVVIALFAALLRTPEDQNLALGLAIPTGARAARAAGRARRSEPETLYRARPRREARVRALPHDCERADPKPPVPPSPPHHRIPCAPQALGLAGSGLRPQAS